MLPPENQLPKAHPAAPRPFDTLVTRLLDMLIALAMLVALSPVLLLVALVVKCSSRGPLFYRQKRVGRDGRLFDICKFRTMSVGADRQGPSVTSADDSRITPLGRLLRSSKLDELPQLFNVVRGDMALVGPRPQVPRFVECFDPSLRAIVLHVRPGITGPTALQFRYEEQMLADKDDRESYYIEQILPVKLEMDAEYVQTRSLRRDMSILTQTAWIISVAPVKRLLAYKRPKGGTKCPPASPIPVPPRRTGKDRPTFVFQEGERDDTLGMDVTR